SVRAVRPGIPAGVDDVGPASAVAPHPPSHSRLLLGLTRPRPSSRPVLIAQVSSRPSHRRRQVGTLMHGGIASAMGPSTIFFMLAPAVLAGVSVAGERRAEAVTWPETLADRASQPRFLVAGASGGARHARGLSSPPRCGVHRRRPESAATA